MSSPWVWSSSLKKLVYNVLSGRSQEADVFYESLSDQGEAGPEDGEEEDKEGKRKQAGSGSHEGRGAKRRRSSENCPLDFEGFHPNEGVSPGSKKLDEEFTFQAVTPPEQLGYQAKTPEPKVGGFGNGREFRFTSLTSEGTSERRAEKSRRQAFGQGSPSLELMRLRAGWSSASRGTFHQKASPQAFGSSDELSDVEIVEYNNQALDLSLPLQYIPAVNPLYDRRTTVDEFGEPHASVEVEPGFHHYPIVSADDVLEPSAIASRREWGAIALRTLNTGNFKYPQKPAVLQDENEKSQKAITRIGKSRKRSMDGDTLDRSKRMRTESPFRDENVV